MPDKIGSLFGGSKVNYQQSVDNNTEKDDKSSKFPPDWFAQAVSQGAAFRQ